MQDADDQDHIQDAPNRGGLRGRIERFLGDRPLSVYGVLVAGVAVLALLLAIVVITSRGNNAGQETPICLDIKRDDAQVLISSGMVERLNVATEQDRPEVGALAVKLDLNDGSCRELPQGASSQPDLNQIIGLVTVFNQVSAGEQRIRFRWEEVPDVPAELRATATPNPTVTPIPTQTPVPTVTAVPPTATVPATLTPVPATATASPPPTVVLPSATPATITAPIGAGPASPPPSPASPGEVAP